MFRSTPLREGRPERLVQLVGADPVSIHAPARGGDGGPKDVHGLAGVSIHAPARGATRERVQRSEDLLFRSTPLREGRPAFLRPAARDRGFDPRPCARGDWHADGDIAARTTVSIHAPARGATLMEGEVRLRLCRFDPRPCARGDWRPASGLRCLCGFDPRPCARGDTCHR